MSKEEQIYDLVKNKFTDLANNYLMIKDKKGKIVPLKLNSAQLKVHKKYEELLKKGIPIRILLLKARQLGMSTWTEGVIYQRNSYEQNRKALIVAHVQDASNNLFDMFKRYHKYLPEEIRPRLDKSNEKKLSYGLLDSEIRIASAEGGEKLGRSATYQDLHLSEVAFWRDAKSAMTALLQTVPEEPNTMIIVESTANGVGGWFHETWVKAVDGENDYVPIFLSWFDIPEYSRDFNTKEERKKFKNNMSSYEKTLYKNFNLTLEQMNWYRYTLKNKLEGDVDLMKQEYPSTAEEAFISSGRPVFPSDICFDNYSKSKRESEKDRAFLTATGELVWDKKGYIEVQVPEIQISPREHFVFAGGVDVAEGLEQGDRSVIKVMDRRTDEVVLTWSGHIDPDLLAHEMLSIQRLLKGKIFFEVEKNNHGLHTIIEGFKIGVNIKYTEDFSKGHKVASYKGLGFVTNLKTKPILIDQLNTWIREGLFTDNEKEFWSECMTFVRDEQGRMGAQGKSKDPSTKIYDDRVIAGALMLNCDAWLPSYYMSKLKPGVRLKRDLPGVPKTSETTF